MMNAVAGDPPTWTVGSCYHVDPAQGPDLVLCLPKQRLHHAQSRGQFADDGCTGKPWVSAASSAGLTGNGHGFQLCLEDNKWLLNWATINSCQLLSSNWVVPLNRLVMAIYGIHDRGCRIAVIVICTMTGSYLGYVHRRIANDWGSRSLVYLSVSAVRNQIRISPHHLWA